MTTIDLKSPASLSYQIKEEDVKQEQDEKTGDVEGTSTITLFHPGHLEIGDHLTVRKYRECVVTGIVTNRDTKGDFSNPLHGILSHWVVTVAFKYTLIVTKIAVKKKKGWQGL